MAIPDVKPNIMCSLVSWMGGTPDALTNYFPLFCSSQTQQQKKKKQDVACFSQPTSLIACHTEWQSLYVYEIQAVQDIVKGLQVIALRKKGAHGIT